MPEAKTPKCVENRYSLKALTIHAVDSIRETYLKNCSRDYQLLLLTPFGFIRGDIEEFTTILSSYKYSPKRPGEYLIVFDYTFEVEGIKKGITQYYNFKVYE